MNQIFQYLFWLWLAGIVALSLIPGGRAAGGSALFLLTKSGFLEHLVAFGTLSWLAVIGFGQRRMVAWASILFTLGVALELVQLPMPNRTFNPYDILANSLGILVVFFSFKVEVVIKKAAGT